MHELEHDAAKARLGEGPPVVRVDFLRGKEFDAALLQQRHRCHHIGCSEADALQVFFRRGIACVVVGFDQLEEEAAAGTLQQQALGHDAETDAIRKSCEAEELRIEPYPVRGPVGADVLNDAEEVQAADRGRLRFDRRDGAKVDVVDREFVMAIDKIDEALANAMNCRDVELHGACAYGDFPRSHVPNPLERGLRIAYAKRECAQDRRFRRMDRVGEIGGLGVDDDVHRPLPIEFDFPGPVPRDRTESQSSPAACRAPAASTWRTR